MSSAISLSGVIVATALPFSESGEIDWGSYRRLLNYCAAPDGITAVFVNGHAGQGAALAADERVEVIEFTRAFLEGRKPLLAGIAALSVREAIAQAEEAKEAGADVGVLFPLPPLGGGVALSKDGACALVGTVCRAVGLPISIFQYPLASGVGYATETLAEMVRIPGVIAIKEGSDTMIAYEDNWRQVKAANPDVAILASNFDWFLAQCAVGADGILSGLATLTPHLLIDLWRASVSKDLQAMRAASDQLYPLVRAIYGGVPRRMATHQKIKAGLCHLGIIDCAAPRKPLLPAAEGSERKVLAAVDGLGLARYATGV